VSRIDPCPDRKERAPESLYVEAIKDPADTGQANGTPVS
jgi:hypothetical protein